MDMIINQSTTRATSFGLNRRANIARRSSKQACHNGAQPDMSFIEFSPTLKQAGLR